jgi:hypothetical protein
MSADLFNMFSELNEKKTKDLEECNRELENESHNSVVRKALLVYKAELLECLDTYNYYLNSEG